MLSNGIGSVSMAGHGGHPISDVLEQRDHAPGRERIALDPEPRQHPIGAQADIGMMAKRLAFVHVGDMALEHRPLEGI